MKNLVLIGSGGHSGACADIIQFLGKYKISFILTTTKEHVNNKNILTYNQENLKKIFKKNIKNTHIGIGQITNLKLRSKIFEELRLLKFIFPHFISKSAYASKLSKIGEGSIIMNGAIINSNTEIGKNVIINSGAIIEHNTTIGDNTHIAPGAIINGTAKIGKNCFIGSGSLIKQGLDIPDFTFVQAGRIILNINELKKR